MRNKKIVVYFCMGLLLATVGCSKSDTNTEENNTTQSQADYEQPQPDSSQSQADNAQFTYQKIQLLPMQLPILTSKKVHFLIWSRAQVLI